MYTSAQNHKQAWLIGLLYGPILPLLLVILGVNYLHIAESIDNIKLGVLLPMTLLAIALASLITWQKWWKPLLWEKRTLPMWTLLMPILMVCTIYNLFNSAIAFAHETSYLVWAALATLGVGFCEEIVYRGITVVGFRSRYAEWQVWLFSSLLFGLIHIWNYFAGQSLDASISQFISAFMSGCFLYMIRRATGTIIVSMLLHAAWDWTLFVSAATGHAPKSDNMIATYLLFVMLALFLVSAKWLFAKPVSQTTLP